MKKQVLFQDLGKDRPYKEVWDYQETLLQQHVKAKAEARELAAISSSSADDQQPTINDQRPTPNLPSVIRHLSSVNSLPANDQPSTTNIPSVISHLPSVNSSSTNYLLFVEHSPVYTLGKSGDIGHVLIGEEERKIKGIEFFKINRGGDITFHGPQQLVGYPIIDLENFKTDLGWYLRSLEEVIILTMAEYGLKGERSKGETGVWLDPEKKGRERKICAMGIRCSRWITMHGFAFNVNTDLEYFNYIVPCGIQNKQVTSLQKELGYEVPFEEVKDKVRKNFEAVFEVEIVEG